MTCGKVRRWPLGFRLTPQAVTSQSLNFLRARCHHLLSTSKNQNKVPPWQLSSKVRSWVISFKFFNVWLEIIRKSFKTSNEVSVCASCSKGVSHYIGKHPEPYEVDLASLCCQHGAVSILKLVGSLSTRPPSSSPQVPLPPPLLLSILLNF